MSTPMFFDQKTITPRAADNMSKADISNQKTAAAAHKHTTLRSPGVPVTRNIRNEM